MSDQIFQWLSAIQSAASLLSTIYLVASLLIGVIIAVIPRPYSHAIKLLGSIIVVGLSLAANSAFVYGIGVFIVATLVTDLEFLEKLAAIVWNRKEYWQYLIDRATPKEVEAKRTAEAMKDVATSSETSAYMERGKKSTQNDRGVLGDQRVIVEYARRFEERVLRALQNGVEPFRGASVDASVRVQTSRSAAQRVSRIADAIVRLGDTHYVIEIKAYRTVGNLPDAVYQLNSIKTIYQAALAERGESPQVTPVLVVPADIKLDTVLNGIVVLRFDFDKGVFINASEVAKHLGLSI